MQITIGDMLNYLEAKDPEDFLEYGFERPHSYRGMYCCACVEPTERKITVSEAIKTCKKLLDRSYTGWKGGEYDYNKDTPLFFAEEGRTEPYVGYHEYDTLWGFPTEIRIKYFESIFEKPVYVNI